MTPEQIEAEIVRARQANCNHAFARGIVDQEAHCVHCGLPVSRYEGATP